jgi:hypothetical protein
LAKKKKTTIKRMRIKYDSKKMMEGKITKRKLSIIKII